MEEVVRSRLCVCNVRRKSSDAGKTETDICNAEELEQYRLTIPEITKIALELNKKGMNIPKDILSAEELVDYLSNL